MGTKHDVLTEEEMASFEVSPLVLTRLDGFLRSHPDQQPSEINVLDWGCGRGRSVARLRERGFNAFGVDVDLEAMANGFALFEQRGLAPGALLKPVEEVGSFDDGFFHLIFSEQVFEHVADLSAVLDEHVRLTAPRGIGVHTLPGSKNVWEGHLHMPFVHWLPKTRIRKYWISLMLLLSLGPRTPWPETRGASFWATAEVYCRYMNERTFYRDVEEIRREFERRGFEFANETHGAWLRFRRLLPKNLFDNGFPRGGVSFAVERLPPG